jgi:hypothetical protein
LPPNVARIRNGGEAKLSALKPSRERCATADHWPLDDDEAYSSVAERAILIRFLIGELSDRPPSRTLSS